MHDFLRLGDERDSVLEETFDIVNKMWQGQDKAREGEPEFTNETKALLQEGLPETGMDASDALELAAEVLDQSIAQSRPRFLAYIGSSGLEVGAVADFLAASYDINVALNSKASTLLEVQTGKWLGDFIGYTGSRGLFTSGGTVSNITGLAVARQKAVPESREYGNSVPLAVYCSSEAHYSNRRAVELLGLGNKAIRSIPIDEQRRMIPAELEKSIKEDIAQGVKPMAIIASAGTTLTGAVDPLREIARIAQTYNVWMHVDGAYGAPAAGADSTRELFDGLELADSVTIDAHKWLFVPKACSILLVRDYAALAETFGHNEAYMPHNTEDPNPVDVTLEYSRPLRALKLWLGFKTHGAEQFRAAIEHDLHLAQMTYDRASVNPRYRVMPHRPQLSVVPLQYIPQGMTDPSQISDHNAKLCKAIVEDGRVYLSPADIDGHVWLRPCYTNFRTEEEDVDVFFEVIEELSHKLHH
ncbi:MAG: L-2,4-diaminobutyrate decarboxylase [Actinomycetota bacterium]